MSYFTFYIVRFVYNRRMENIFDDQNQINSEKRKVMLIIAGLVFLALLGIAFGAYQYQKGNISSVPGCLTGGLFNTSTGEPCVGAEDPKATPETGATDYQKTIDTFINQRLLFNADCESDPAIIELPTGGEILLANHSKRVIELGLQNKTAILPPYRFILSDPLLVAEEVPVTCNGEVRATVIIK